MGEDGARAGDLEIRSFVESDRAALVGLWGRCDLVRPWNDADRDIDRKLAVDDGLLLVGLVDEVLVAAAMAGYDGHRGWINYLAVDPESQGGGLGRQLLDEVERRLRDLGCPKINLQIRRTNLGAVAFYESLGFVEDDVIGMGKRLIHDDSGLSDS